MSRKGKALVGVYKAGGWIARSLPDRSVERVTQMLGAIAYRFMASKRAILTRHMRRAAASGSTDAEIQQLVRSAFKSYARYYLESFRLTALSPEEIDEGVTVQGGEPVFQALADGRGVVTVVPHLGGWEWLAYWMTLVRGVRLTVVVEPIEPSELFEWFRDFRRDLGMNVVPLGPDAGREVTAALAKGDLVVLLSDRDLTGSGAEVEFFGETTTLPNGPAVVAMRSGSPLFALACFFGPGTSHEVVVLPEIDLRRQGRLRADADRVTQDVTNALETLILRAPEQWHLLQPNWPSDYEWLSEQ